MNLPLYNYEEANGQGPYLNSKTTEIYFHIRIKSIGPLDCLQMGKVAKNDLTFHYEESSH